LADLTCDSDGKVSCFAQTELRDGSTKELLDLHQLKPHQPYYIGMFLTGAYQEILGSMHNLYGDTHILVVSSSNDSPLGYTIKQTIPGNTIDQVLQGFQFEPQKMNEQVRIQAEQSLKLKEMTLQQYRTLVNHYERSLRNYTYLSSETEDLLPPGFELEGDNVGDNNNTNTTGKQSAMSRYIFSFKPSDVPPQFQNGEIGGPKATVHNFNLKNNNDHSDMNEQ
jgi:hypothetical protein